MSWTPEFTLSAPHKVKAYADDLSIISDSLKEHTETVQTINQLSRKIDLMIHPDKRVTLVFDVKKILKNHRLKLCGTIVLIHLDPISDNSIRSIQNTATKFKKWLRLSRHANASDPFPPYLPTERLKVNSHPK